MILIFSSSFLLGQAGDRSWDDTLNAGWPAGCRLVRIVSPADSSLQQAWFYASTSKEPSPLIVSLHTWSGDYNQEDPLAAEAVRRGWNYIHPDIRGRNNRPEAAASDLVISDIRDAILYALRHSGADPSDVHLIGVSGGGYDVLAAYMKLDYPVRSFNAWAPVTDLESWYYECRSRGLGYASDIEKITTGGSGFDPEEARSRSPLFMEYNPDLRKDAFLSVYTGINDGYTGSVPISHSVEFYNRIIGFGNPGNKDMRVSDSVLINLLTRKYDPGNKMMPELAGRKVILSAGTDKTSLVIFEGGHEMLVPHALSLIPVIESKVNPSYSASILVIGDSNAAGPDSWPGRLNTLLPWSTVINTSRSGNTTGFDNLGREDLNTLKQIDFHLKEVSQISGGFNKPVVVLIALGTNDAKYIFRKRQREVPVNMAALIDSIRNRLEQPEVYIIAPPLLLESHDTTGKYTGSGKRVAELEKKFRQLAGQKGTGFIDLHHPLSKGFADKSPDGVHFDPATRDEVALHIASAISSKPMAGEDHNTGHSLMPDTNVILPPAWAFGVLYGGYTDQEGTIERIRSIQAHDYPIDAYWIDSWFWGFNDRGAGPEGYIDFTGDTVSFPDRGKMWSWMQENGIKGGFWIWDCIQETGNEDVFRDFLDKGYFSSVYLNRNPWHNNGTTTAMFSQGKELHGTLCGNINFDDPAAVALFREKMKPFFLEGADFIKLDRTDKISVCRAMYRMTAEEGLESRGRGLILSHSGGTDNDEFKRYPIKWTDDTRADWTVESPLVTFDPWVPPVALKENIRMYTDPAKATVRVPFLTNDLGGFDMGRSDRPDEELFIRWMQFSMFCPVTEVFSQPENPTSNLAWKYSSLADSLFRVYSQMRMKLFPYLYSYAHLSRLESTNMIRPIPGQAYEFMLGDEFLVAPVFRKSETTRDLYVPEGEWVNYWTGETLSGGSTLTVPAPLGQIPLLVRQGAIIPERRYSSSIERGSNDTLLIHIYPGMDRSFRLIEDDGLSNDYLEGIYALTEITSRASGNGFTLVVSAVKGGYRNMTSHRSLELIVHSCREPARVLINGRSEPFDHDTAKGTSVIRAGSRDRKKSTEIRIFFE